MKTLRDALHEMARRVGTAGQVNPADLVKRTLEQVLPGGASGASQAWPVPDALRNLMPGRTPSPAAAPPPGRFVSGSHQGPAGARPYRLYVPTAYRGTPLPLVVMLHGCTQSAEDFAAGTRMNALAEAQPCLVLYPEQVAAANRQRCWNWFEQADQRRGDGEASLIAGMVQDVMREYRVDRRRVFVAGLSAGGAAAANLGMAYPDLFAAIGVHSGLACGAASHLSGAFAAMQQGRPGAAPLPSPLPAIVFHGDRDATVSLHNAEAVVAQSTPPGGLRRDIVEGRVPGGHAWTRTRLLDAAGNVQVESWLVQGGGHAWFGGSHDGTYTDPQGPDASREMLRFFLDHPKPV